MPSRFDKHTDVIDLADECAATTNTRMLSDVSVSVADFQTLRPRAWINDACIAAYFKLLQKQTTNRIWLFSTYFFTALSGGAKGYDYASVRRWTRSSKIRKATGIHTITNIFELEKMIVPIHWRGNHWLCCCVDFRKHCVELFDSMPDMSSANSIFGVMRRFLADEFMDKIGCGQRPFESSKWTFATYPERCPRQENSFDCGCFLLSAAQSLSNNEFPQLRQSDAHAFRREVALAITRFVS